jgi:ribosomal protein S12 methylthiotransferase accessory factor
MGYRLTGRGAIVPHPLGLIVRSAAGTSVLEGATIASLEKHPGLIDFLERQDLIEREDAPPAPDPFLRLWTNQPDRVHARLSTARIVLAGHPQLTAPLTRSLELHGISVVESLDDKDPPDLLLAAFTNDQVHTQHELACQAHIRGIRSLFAIVDGLEYLIGPAVDPGRSACWNCARLRRLAHEEHPWASQAIHDFQLRNPKPAAAILNIPTLPILVNTLAWEAIKLITGCPESRLFSSVLIQNALTSTASIHPILPVPDCAVCQGAALKRLSPESTLPPGFIDPRTGIIAAIEEDRDPARESTLIRRAKAVLGALTSDHSSPVPFETCAGKGFESPRAHLGALGESIERYSASRVPIDRLLHAAPHDLPNGSFLDPRSLVHYADAQYRDPSFPFVAYLPERPHRWTRGHWLCSGREIWIPALPAYYHFPEGAEDPYCQVTSSGLAAGSNLEDASFRAILELLERDAVMTTWFRQMPARRIEVDRTLDPRIRRVLEALERLTARIELYLLFGPTPVQTVLCLGFGNGESWPGLTASSAAHPSIHEAIRSAVLEHCHSGVSLAQLIRKQDTRIPTSPNEIRPGRFLDHALYYAPPSRARACDFLTQSPAIRLDEIRELDSPATLETLRTQLTQSNIRVALADLTAPDVQLTPFRVVRALSPDLVPLHCGHNTEHRAHPRLKGPLNQNPHPCC